MNVDGNCKKNLNCDRNDTDLRCFEAIINLIIDTVCLLFKL